MSAIVHKNLINLDRNLGSLNVHRKKVYRKVGETYMNSDVALCVLPMLLNDLENAENSQKEINICYNNLAEFLLKEAECSLRKKSKKRKGTKYKEYWDDELSNKWKLMHKAEFNYCKACKNRDKMIQLKRALFCSQQSNFDRCLKYKKRTYCCEIMMNIESCYVKNPNAFWTHIRKLGPNKCYTIPWEVKINGELITDHDKVLSKWKQDFENLYNFETDSFDEDFRMQREQEMALLLDDTALQNDCLNIPITISEVKKSINKARTGKVVGADGISNELLKNKRVCELLFQLFSLCFKMQNVRNVWKCMIIHPIPKESGRVIDPLKYRGMLYRVVYIKYLVIS